MTWLEDITLQKPAEEDNSFEARSAKGFAEEIVELIDANNGRINTLDFVVKFFNSICRFQKDYYSKEHVHIIPENIPNKYLRNFSGCLWNILAEFDEPDLDEFDNVPENIRKCVNMMQYCTLRRLKELNL